jgi:hypothetical protein
MEFDEWLAGIDVAVTVCDGAGVVIAMNEKATRTFAADGGAALIGRDLFSCHPPAAREKLRELFLSRRPNSYTIEKNGVRKLIHQTPWYRLGEFAGLVEFALPIPADMPHFVRDRAPAKD